MTRSAYERVQDVLEAIARCERYPVRFDDPDGEVVEMAFQAAIRYIAVIGEAANHLPPEIIDAHPEIPWPEIVEMRHSRARILRGRHRSRRPDARQGSRTPRGRTAAARLGLTTPVSRAQRPLPADRLPFTLHPLTESVGHEVRQSAASVPVRRVSGFLSVRHHRTSPG